MPAPVSSVCKAETHVLPKSGRSPAAEELLLVQELTHRFNNDLASLTSFVSLAAARSTHEEVKLALAGVLQRIFDLASIQRALRMPPDQSLDCAKYLAELCRSISSAKLQYRAIRIEFIASPLILNSLDCWRVGMIVAELINNAARHAFDTGGGQIQVAMTDRQDCVEFTVADNGRGLSNAREGQGRRSSAIWRVVSKPHLIFAARVRARSRVSACHLPVTRQSQRL
jgi:two-component sensor histidine kinase